MRGWRSGGMTAMALMMALAPLCVAAQSAGQPVAGAPDIMPGPSLFISPSGQPFRAAAGQPYPVAAWFAQVDKRGDGRIDRAEFRADSEAFFHVLDANHDGVIDPFEMQAYENEVVPEILARPAKPRIAACAAAANPSPTLARPASPTALRLSS
jgi:hypothetical protein